VDSNGMNSNLVKKSKTMEPEKLENRDVTIRTNSVHINVTPKSAFKSGNRKSNVLSHDPLFVLGLSMIGMTLLIVWINDIWTALIYAVILIITLPFGGWVTGIVVIFGIIDCGIVPILLAVALLLGGKFMLR